MCASSISSSSSSYSVFCERDSFLIQLPISPLSSSHPHFTFAPVLLSSCVCHLLGPLHLPLSILHVSSPLSSLLTTCSSVTNLTLLLQSYSLLFLCVCIISFSPSSSCQYINHISSLISTLPVILLFNYLLLSYGSNFVTIFSLILVLFLCIISPFHLPISTLYLSPPLPSPIIFLLN